ncbi:MAG: cytochrome oxidase Cu insertion factor (SCO1/SenC/PrrC family) [Myxococcota bacterium]|jgi:cytochrome oxidase Cu insertion factor (SCO1/SenC/PrrC family)
MNRALKVGVVLILGLLVTLTYRTWWVAPRGAPLQAEAQASPFSLPDQTGKTVALSDLLAQGPAVVIFYRGYW